MLPAGKKLFTITGHGKENINRNAERDAALKGQWKISPTKTIRLLIIQVRGFNLASGGFLRFGRQDGFRRKTNEPEK